MTQPIRYGDKVSITVTGTVIKDSPRFPTAAVLVRLDPEYGGDANWFSPGACTVTAAAPELPGEEK